MLNPIDQTLLFIKRFSILKHKRENQPVLRVVTPILVNSDFTFQQALEQIKADLAQMGEPISDEYELLIELPCRPTDNDQFDLLDADRD